MCVCVCVCVHAAVHVCVTARDGTRYDLQAIHSGIIKVP